MKDNKKSPGLYGKELARKGIEARELLSGMEEAMSDSVGYVENFPPVETMSEENQVIFAAYVMGHSQSFIARAMGKNQSSINRTIRKIDPDGRYALSAEARKTLLTKQLQTKATEALTCITAEKLMESDAKDLMNIAKGALATSEQLNQSKHKSTSPSRLSALMDEIAKESLSCMDEAEIEEEDAYRD